MFYIPKSLGHLIWECSLEKWTEWLQGSWLSALVVEFWYDQNLSENRSRKDKTKEKKNLSQTDKENQKET